MSDKKIDGALASYLADAATNLGHIEFEMRRLQWVICFRDDMTPDPRQIKSHCRKLLHALDMIEHRLMMENDVVEQPGTATAGLALRQVK